ncbi:MAG: type II toxin-antitoxin system HigB family toxin [Planctomycetota bacterium]
MDIVGANRLVAFCRKHADARTRFARWRDVVEDATWTKWPEVRATFPNADLVRRGGIDYVIFNIGGNDYRLSAFIQYQSGTVDIDRPMTHDEYMSWSKA